MASRHALTRSLSGGVGIALAVGFLVVATSAHATPVDVFFQGTVPSGNGDFHGLSAQSVSDFLAAGGQRISVSADDTYADPDKDFVAVTTPDNRDSTGITDNQRGGPDFIANPAKATNNWVINPLVDFDHLWIVFRGQSPDDPNGGPGGYLPQNVGLNVDPMSSTDIWRLFTLPETEDDPETSYLALYAGGTIDSEDPDIIQTIHYRVRQALLTDPDDPQKRDLLPQYLIGYMEVPLVPEPGSVALLGVGLLGLAVRRARR